MNSDAQRIHFGKAPDAYDPKYIETVIRDISGTIAIMLSPGTVRCAKLNISQIPTASTGLRSGDIWADAGVLKVIP